MIKTSQYQNVENGVTLRLVEKSDCRFLFSLLGQRTPEVSISHKKMPSYKEHIKFVLSKPYSKWYIINYKKKKVGSIYLSKQDEIGIFLIKGFQAKGIGKTAMDLLIQKNPRNIYLANVNPKNKKSKKFFKKNGFKLLQYTYELTTLE